MNTIDCVCNVLSSFNPFGVVIQKESCLIEDLGLDSITMVEFLAELEREFNIQIVDSELTNENFRTVNTVSSFLKKKLEDPSVS